MSEMSKKARAENRTKANRLAGGTNDPHKKVDSSDWKPNEALNADRKTGARPIRARIYKAGGAIQGDRARRADKLARGGKAGDAGELGIHNTVQENKDKLGSYHEGGYKKGGRTKRDMGGMADPREAAAGNMAAAGARSGVPQGRFQVASQGKSPFLRTGGSAKAKALCAGGGMAKGGVTKLSGLPGWGQKSLKEYEPDSPENKQLMRPMSYTYGDGYRVDLDSGEGTPKKLPKTSREKRASGGRTKGKTNINIIIGRGGNDGPQQLPPQGVVRPPPAPPVMPPPGLPPGGPPPGLAGPGGPPPGMPPGGPPPMMRKSGGRAGHRTYRSYKDMDAGSSSGLGRLEEAEIAAHKR